jgi:PAS domain S-box-containing protein
MEHADQQDGDERERLQRDLPLVYAAFDSASDAIQITDLAGKSIYHNRAFLDLFNYTVTQMAAAGGSAALFSDPAVADTVLGTLRNGLSWSGEVTMLTREGRVVPIALRVDRISDEQNNTLGLVAVCRDITERKRSEEEIRSAYQFQERVMEAATNAIAVLDSGGNFILANQRAAEITGYSIEELLGQSFRMLLAAEEVERVSEVVMQALNHNVSVTQFETPLVRKDGAIRIIRFSLAPLALEGGQPGVVGTAEDITERKRAEESQRKSEDRYRDLVENSGLLIGTHDLEGNILLANQSVLQHAGFERVKEGQGLNIRDVLAPDVRNLFQNYLNEILAEGHAQGEMKIRLPNGAMRIIEYNNSLRREGLPQPIIRCIGRDVTKRKLAQALREKQVRILEMIATGAPLPETLEQIVRMIEGQSNEMLGSILLLDDEGKHLRHGAAPSLPESYTGAIDGAAIGPQVGSCGTAAYLKESVIAHDIMTDPRWMAYRELALVHGLHACWSTPVFSTGNDVIGTFAMYYCEPRHPSPQDYELVKVATHIASIAIERKRAEERLRLLGSAVINAHDVVLITEAEPLDPPGPRIIYANAAFTRMTGYELEEVVHHNPRLLQGPKSSRTELERLRQAIERREPVQAEIINYRKGGDEFWVDMNIVPVVDEQGVLTHFVSIQRETTERRRAVERIREQAALLDQAHEAIFALDLETRITYWSKGAERMLGWTAKEVVGRPATDLFHQEPTSGFQEAWRTVCAAGTWQGEIVKQAKDRSVVVAESSWSLVRDEKGEPRLVLVTAIDITEKKHLAADLERTAQLRLIGELAAELAHEIKTPLAGIQCTVELMIEDRAENDHKLPALQDVLREVERIDAAVRWLLDLARPRSLKLAAVSLGEVIHRAVRMMQAQLVVVGRGHEIKLEVEAMHDPLVFPLDEIHIEGAISNLLVNAVDAIEGEGRVMVRFTRNGNNSAIIEVTDTGKGVTPADLSRLFTPFFTTKPEGTGLGLATVKLIVGLHKGRIEVNSKVGQGSTFRIYLPLAR